MRGTIFILVLFIGGAGCSHKTGGPFDMAFTPTRTLPEAKKLAQNSSIYCPDQDNCPSAISLLTTAHGAPSYGVGRCTGFLIADDMMVTNSHCIPDDLKREDSSCSGRIWAHFPKTTKHAPEIRKCVRVRFTSKNDPARAQLFFDIALIELDRPSRRTPLKISREGLKNDEPVTLFKVDPLQTEKPMGIVSHVLCRAKHESFHLPNNTESLDPVHAIADCATMPGNSGSPGLDSENRVRVVLQAGTPDHTLNQLQKHYADYLDGELVVPMSFASNAACFPFGKDGREIERLPGQCKKRMGKAPSRNMNYLRDAETKLRTSSGLASDKMDESNYPIVKLGDWEARPFLNKYLQLQAKVSPPKD